SCWSSAIRRFCSACRSAACSAKRAKRSSRPQPVVSSSVRRSGIRRGTCRFIRVGSPVVNEASQHELQRTPQPALAKKCDDGRDEGQGRERQGEGHWRGLRRDPTKKAAEQFGG